CQQRNLYPLTF
nr:immunoglobulin light chain junction region [Macaca mulatta]MPN91173.1 immunoglobulin light chain junction region [Macaca mulatta]MPN91641.1 immunoglobulin light chain junction region [Macaca mulatta]MPN92445.1 immunoglobulin light chain junction region [Macaca mulatta]MPN92561.1 immunoglobulin light chain junction region [Macaca mulatta]